MNKRKEILCPSKPGVYIFSKNYYFFINQEVTFLRALFAEIKTFLQENKLIFLF